IHEYVLRNWRVVKVATTKAQRKLFFNLRKATKHLGWLSAEETQAVAEDLGVNPAEVTEMERRLAARDQTFDPLPADDEDENGYAPQTYLPAADEDPAVALESDDWEAATHAGLHAGLKALDERSRDIVQSRWLTEDKATLHQLADRYGVSAERIRQIEAAAIKKLGKLVEAA
ncbi:MAG: sigma factor-like helix-turn-helix DNA-binding protein, partial [Pseudomonadota bacterium]